MTILDPQGDIDPDAWRNQALCRDSSPELFFPIGTTGIALESIAGAKAVCAECEVTEECLNFALDTRQDSGVWGGLSEEERRTIRRRRAAEKRASRANAANN